MLKASTMGQDGRPVFIFGLVEEDLKKLLEIGVSCHSLEEMGGLSAGTVIIAAAKTSNELTERLEQLGLSLPSAGPGGN